MHCARKHLWLVAAAVASACTGGPGVLNAEGFAPSLHREVERFVRSAIQRRVFPGCQIVVLRDGATALDEAYGTLSYGSGSAPVTRETRYDVASLTKIVATAGVAMALHAAGRLDLDTKAADLVSGFGDGRRERITLRLLLAHSGGLVGWKPLYKTAGGKHEMLAAIREEPLKYDPGTSMDYSDLGYMLLGVCLEKAGGAPLDALAESLVSRPLGMRRTSFGPLPPELPAAPTEWVESRGGFVRGEVHDENAHAFGGVAGHAGLFSTAGDVARFLQAVLAAEKPFSRSTVDLFTKRVNLVIDSSRALGFDTPYPNSSAGRSMSPDSIGHTGFTGTSAWADKRRRLVIVCLTNRVHPTRRNKRIHSFRRGLHDLVIDALIDDPGRGDR